MSKNWSELHHLQSRIGKLSPEDQLYLVERILAKLRGEHFTDQAAADRDAADMATDPEIQQVLKGDDLPLTERARDAG